MDTPPRGTLLRAGEVRRPPWPDASGHTEILVEIKMPGDHLNNRTLERALLRRQARQVQRVEAIEPFFDGQEPLWLVAPILPNMLLQRRDVVRAPALPEVSA